MWRRIAIRGFEGNDGRHDISFPSLPFISSLPSSSTLPLDRCRLLALSELFFSINFYLNHPPVYPARFRRHSVPLFSYIASFELNSYNLCLWIPSTRWISAISDRSTLLSWHICPEIERIRLIDCRSASWVGDHPPHLPTRFLSSPITRAMACTRCKSPILFFVIHTTCPSWARSVSYSRLRASACRRAVLSGFAEVGGGKLLLSQSNSRRCQRLS
jgi:hypothetical protein